MNNIYAFVPSQEVIELFHKLKKANDRRIYNLESIQQVEAEYNSISAQRDSIYKKFLWLEKSEEKPKTLDKQLKELTAKKKELRNYMTSLQHTVTSNEQEIRNYKRDISRLTFGRYFPYDG